ncbi:MAG: carbon monoxide dehydrogenase subunit G [Acidobacteria bacterium]|nr:carbon monoxide dehydrogenase subunit G [Acidobacteriota bacterium]
MRIEGQFAFENTSTDSVWAFLTDPDRIAQCLPGCEKITKTGDDTYDMQMRIGIGAISGTFTGAIRLHDLQPTSSYQMSVTGSGAPGFVNGEGTVQLSTSDAGTLLQYSGDVSAGGPIASVGQRLITGAARMIIGQFFKCVAQKLI